MVLYAPMAGRLRVLQRTVRPRPPPSRRRLGRPRDAEGLQLGLGAVGALGAGICSRPGSGATGSRTASRPACSSCPGLSPPQHCSRCTRPSGRGSFSSCPASRCCSSCAARPSRGRSSSVRCCRRAWRESSRAWRRRCRADCVLSLASLPRVPLSQAGLRRRHALRRQHRRARDARSSPPAWPCIRIANTTGGPGVRSKPNGIFARSQQRARDAPRLHVPGIHRRRAHADRRRRCRPMRVFPATVAGGDIVVCAIPALRHGGA